MLAAADVVVRGDLLVGRTQLTLGDLLAVLVQPPVAGVIEGDGEVLPAIVFDGVGRRDRLAAGVEPQVIGGIASREPEVIGVGVVAEIEEPLPEAVARGAGPEGRGEAV